MSAEQVEASLDNMSKLVKKLALETKLLRKKGKLDDVTKEMTPLEAAKLNANVAYMINSIYKSNLADLTKAT